MGNGGNEVAPSSNRYVENIFFFFFDNAFNVICQGSHTVQNVKSTETNIIDDHFIYSVTCTFFSLFLLPAYN